MDERNTLNFGKSTEKKAAKERRLKTLEDGVARLSKDLTFLMGEHTTLLGKHGTLLERVAKLEAAGVKNVTEHEAMKKETVRVAYTLQDLNNRFQDVIYGGRHGKTDTMWVLGDKVLEREIQRIYGRLEYVQSQVYELRKLQGSVTPDPEYSDTESVSVPSVDSDEDLPGESNEAYDIRIALKRKIRAHIKEIQERAKNAALPKPADDSDSGSNASPRHASEDDDDYIDRLTQKHMRHVHNASPPGSTSMRPRVGR